MNSAILIALVIVWFVFIYKWYAGKLEKRLVNPDDGQQTPAEKFRDDNDYVPTRPALLFGHHFAAIAGAGPIIGPIIATAAFGWVGTLLWILLGAAFIGGVHDYLAMVVSVRSDGKSIPAVTDQTVGKRSRTLFISFVWLALILVIGVFYDVAIKTMIADARVVIPTLALIPISMLAGIMIYKYRMSSLLASLISLALLALCIFIGDIYPVTLPYSKETSSLIWLLIFAGYTVAASVVPVWLLLQPRGYISSYLLFIGVGAGLAGIFLTHPPVESAGAYNGFWTGKDPLWPTMFILVACGAASGFHSIIASGTSCKQLSKESHAKFVSFGAMLAEGLVAAFVTLAVAAVFLKDSADVKIFGNILDKEGPISIFGRAYGYVTAPFMSESIGKLFAISIVNAFVITTLDTCVRLGRLITAEICHDPWGLSKSRWFGTLLIVIPSALLAGSGKFSVIWPIFGSANQLVGALTLIVLTAYFLRKGKPGSFTFYPAMFMLITTIGALMWQGYQCFFPKDGKRDFLLGGIALVLLVLSFVVCAESWNAIRKCRKEMSQPNA